MSINIISVKYVYFMLIKFTYLILNKFFYIFNNNEHNFNRYNIFILIKIAY